MAFRSNGSVPAAASAVSGALAQRDHCEVSTLITELAKARAAYRFRD
jgi:hypothetical protein